MADAEVWTVGRLLGWTTDYLKGRGAESPRLDAEVLLAEALGRQRIDLYTAFDEVPGEEPRGTFRELVRRRAQGTPVAYLVGRREFYSHEFHVTPDVLIPRPETEFVVIALLDRIKERAKDEVVRACDVGTGSGIIAICAALHAPQCRVTAADKSPKALEVARRNVVEHGVEHRVELVESDLMGGLPVDQQFDFVASNPPYVATGELALMATEVKDHEPREALVAGPRGTEVIEALIPQAAERLVTGGWLLMEINPKLHEAVECLITADGRFELAPTVHDLARLPRVVQARRL
jgi:release factor glutamine methyltransferase